MDEAEPQAQPQPVVSVSGNATETPRKYAEKGKNETDATETAQLPTANGEASSAETGTSKQSSASPATTLEEVDPEEANSPQDRNEYNPKTDEIDRTKVDDLHQDVNEDSDGKGKEDVDGKEGVPGMAAADFKADASLLAKLEADLKASSGKSEEELKLIRTLLHAEATHDAGELIDAQDIILSSGMADGLEDIKQSPNIQNAKTVRQTLHASPFKPHQADFTELVSGTAPASEDQKNGESSVPNNTTEEKDELNIPANGLNDEECAAFVGSYEENLVVNALMEKLPMETFGEVFEQDPEFKSEFRWWARACLRARRYRLERAVDLVTRYAAWRKDIGLNKSDQSKLKAELETGFCMFLEEARCVNGRAILLVRLQFHDPTKYKPHDVVIALHNVILYALRSDDLIQAQGFTVLHDMTKVRYRNLDFSLAEKISKCFNSTFPMRYGRLVMYNPPFFFSAVYRIVSMFLSKKMKERLVKVPKDRKHPAFVTLAKYVHQKDLPSYMGGGQELNPLQFSTNLISALFPISKSLEKTISHETS